MANKKAKELSKKLLCLRCNYNIINSSLKYPRENHHIDDKKQSLENQAPERLAFGII